MKSLTAERGEGGICEACDPGPSRKSTYRENQGRDRGPQQLQFHGKAGKGPVISSPSYDEILMNFTLVGKRSQGSADGPARLQGTGGTISISTSATTLHKAITIVNLLIQPSRESDGTRFLASNVRPALSLWVRLPLRAPVLPLHGGCARERH